MREEKKKPGTIRHILYLYTASTPPDLLELTNCFERGECSSLSLLARIFCTSPVGLRSPVCQTQYVHYWALDESRTGSRIVDCWHIRTEYTKGSSPRFLIYPLGSSRKPPLDFELKSHCVSPALNHQTRVGGYIIRAS